MYSHYNYIAFLGILTGISVVIMIIRLFYNLINSQKNSEKKSTINENREALIAKGNFEKLVNQQLNRIFEFAKTSTIRKQTIAIQCDFRNLVLKCAKDSIVEALDDIIKYAGNTSIRIDIDALKMQGNILVENMYGNCSSRFFTEACAALLTLIPVKSSPVSNDFQICLSCDGKQSAGCVMQ